MSIRLFKLNKGFTLVELLVTIMIFVIMTTILALRYGDFSKGIILTNLVYDVALAIRQAQSYGINVSDTTPDGRDADYSQSYGVHFNINEPTKFILFRDDGTLKNFYVAGSDTIIKEYQIKNGNVLQKICYDSTVNPTCGISGTAESIVFARPSPSPIISRGNRQALYLRFAAPDGSTQSIMVRSSGQISIENQ